MTLLKIKCSISSVNYNILTEKFQAYTHMHNHMHDAVYAGFPLYSSLYDFKLAVYINKYLAGYCIQICPKTWPHKVQMRCVSTKDVKGTLDNFSLIPQLFSKKLRFFIPLDVYPYVVTARLILLANAT